MSLSIIWALALATLSVSCTVLPDCYEVALAIVATAQPSRIYKRFYLDSAEISLPAKC